MVPFDTLPPSSPESLAFAPSTYQSRLLSRIWHPKKIWWWKKERRNRYIFFFLTTTLFHSPNSSYPRLDDIRVQDSFIPFHLQNFHHSQLYESSEKDDFPVTYMHRQFLLFLFLRLRWSKRTIIYHSIFLLILLPISILSINYLCIVPNNLTWKGSDDNSILILS